MVPEALSKSQRYEVGARLRHHAGSVWEVVDNDLPGDGEWGEGMVLLRGDYRIECVEGSQREGFIGGETVGVTRRVHADYLHGDGWTYVPAEGQEQSGGEA
ncbi:MAG TPA: hypothetical protein VFT50_09295 [Baekduia sp.]|nr:hypothetical protein [Baekduia sp.]